jgi:hypothetical protein
VGPVGQRAHWRLPGPACAVHLLFLRTLPLLFGALLWRRARLEEAVTAINVNVLGAHIATFLRAGTGVPLPRALGLLRTVSWLAWSTILCTRPHPGGRGQNAHACDSDQNAFHRAAKTRTPPECVSHQREVPGRGPGNPLHTEGQKAPLGQYVDALEVPRPWLPPGTEITRCRGCGAASFGLLEAVALDRELGGVADCAAQCPVAGAGSGDQPLGHPLRRPICARGFRTS